MTEENSTLGNIIFVRSMEESIAVQELLFKHQCSWGLNLKITKDEDKNFLRVDSDGTIYTISHFDEVTQYIRKGYKPLEGYYVLKNPFSIIAARLPMISIDIQGKNYAPGSILNLIEQAINSSPNFKSEGRKKVIEALNNFKDVWVQEDISGSIYK